MYFVDSGEASLAGVFGVHEMTQKPYKAPAPERSWSTGASKMSDCAVDFAMRGDSGEYSGKESVESVLKSQ